MATPNLTIVGLGGSVAAVSRSRTALGLALEGAGEAGVETRLLDLRELALPMYDPDAGEPPPSAVRLMEECYASNGMIWSSPMYQGTISGARGGVARLRRRRAGEGRECRGPAPAPRR